MTQNFNSGRTVLSNMSLETGQMSDADYYRAADFVKNKTALQMNGIYKQCRKAPSYKKTLWGRIKSLLTYRKG